MPHTPRPACFSVPVSLYFCSVVSSDACAGMAALSRGCFGGASEKIRGRDHSAQLVELCFLSIVERFMSGGESLCRRRALIQDLWSLWITLNIIDTITCPLGLPSPLEGLGLGVNPDARGGRRTSSARTARFGVPPSRVARRRPGRRRCCFPLSAACTRSALWRS